MISTTSATSPREELLARALDFELPLRLHPRRELVSDILRERGSYSRNDLMLMTRYLSPGDGFVDIGANLGWYTLFASRLVGPTGQIFAFEPESENFELLTTNIARLPSPNVTPVQAAVSDEDGEAPLQLDPSNSGNHRILGPQHSPILDPSRQSVPTLRLDTFFNQQTKTRELPRIRLIKSDAQGFEPRILAGMQETLRRFEPVLLLEFAPRHIRDCGGSPFEIFAFIEKSGYLPFLIQEDTSLELARIPALLSVTSLFEMTQHLLETGLSVDLLLLRPAHLENSGLLESRDPGLLSTLGQILWNSDHHEIGAKFLARASQLEPANFEFAAEVARRQQQIARYDESRAILERACAFQPPGSLGHQRLQYHLGWHELRDGDLLRGLRMDRLGRKIRSWGAVHAGDPARLLREGQNLSNTTVLIHGEGGVGDELIHARFAQVIQARGGRALWQTMHPIESLLSRTPGMNGVLTNSRLCQETCDYWVPATDLPVILQLNESELPTEPYVFADPGRAQYWRGRVEAQAPRNALRIGLRWAGSPENDGVLGRAVDFRELRTLFEIPEAGEVSWFSLQVPADSSIKNISTPELFTDWSPELRDWEDTAALMNSMDLIISVCTGTTHLAAAMGKPVWMFCLTDCYYPWASKTDRSLWYPSVRLFRQTRYRSWAEPIQRMTHELRQLLDERVFHEK